MIVRDIWITGMGIISALGDGVQIHANAMENEKSGLTSRTLFDGVAPDPCIIGMVPEAILPTFECSAANRANLLIEHASCEGIRSAGLKRGFAADTILGTTLGNMQGATSYYRELLKGATPSLDLVRGFIQNSITQTVVRQHDIKGKQLTVSSACASGTTAIGTAWNRIRHGLCERAVAGGVDALSQFVVAGFNSLRLLSKKVCRPFDAARDGLNPAEGAGVVILEESALAKKRGTMPLARVIGYGTALEAFHYTRSNPDGSGIAAAIRKALESAKIDRSEIDHIHAHGTATVFNDLSEYTGFSSVFGPLLSSIPVCSTKSMTGHTFGAAGAIACILGVLTLTNGVIPPTLFHETKDSSFELLKVSVKPEWREVRRVLTVSLGFGGEVAALILEKPA